MLRYSSMGLTITSVRSCRIRLLCIKEVPLQLRYYRLHGQGYWPRSALQMQQRLGMVAVARLAVLLVMDLRSLHPLQISRHPGRPRLETTDHLLLSRWVCCSYTTHRAKH